MNITARQTILLNSAANVRAIRVDSFAQKATTNAAQSLITAGLLVAVADGKASITDAGRAVLASATVTAPVVAAPRVIARRETEANKVAAVTAPKGKLFTSTVTLAGGSTRTVTRAKPYAFAVLNVDGTVARWTNA